MIIAIEERFLTSKKLILLESVSSRGQKAFNFLVLPCLSQQVTDEVLLVSSPSVSLVFRWSVGKVVEVVQLFHPFSNSMRSFNASKPDMKIECYYSYTHVTIILLFLDDSFTLLRGNKLERSE